MIMIRQTLPVFLLGTAIVLGLAACGDDDAASPASESTLPGVGSTADGDGYAHPTGADDVIIEYAQVGGFVPREYAFQETPNVLISGDGRVFTRGAQIEIYPGPLLPAVQVQTITEEGIQAILAAADEAGLFAPVAYDAPTNVADAPTARVAINVDGTTWVHEAYALGIEGPDTTDPMLQRQALSEFISVLTDLADPTASSTVGEPTLFEPDSYQIEAVPVDDVSAYSSDGIEPTVIDWPSSVSVRLSEASSCVEVSAGEIGDTLTAANQLTFFIDEGVTYQLAARPTLPGRSCL